MDQNQQRRLATFVVNRENMHNRGSTGLRCMLARHHLASNGIFVVEVEWHHCGRLDFTPEPYLFLDPEEVESLRGVWMAGATTDVLCPITEPERMAS
jgi:hypothetical protein